MFQHFYKSLLLLLTYIHILSCTHTPKENVTNTSLCYTASDCLVEIQDPWEQTNRRIFKFNTVIDRYFLKPVAVTYDAIVPEIVQLAINNFFDNLGRPLSSVNSALQQKSVPAILTFNSFLIDSFFGLGGLLNISELMGVKQYQEDFNQTLAFWGVESGPYVVLPFWGPSSVRGSAALFTQTLIRNEYSPNAVTTYPVLFLNVVNSRSRLLGLDGTAEAVSLDQYQLLKDVYTSQFRKRLYDGTPPQAVFDDFDAGADGEEDESLDSLLE